MAEGMANDQILKLIQETRRVAYDQGYQDALRDQAALRTISTPPASPPLTEMSREPIAREHASHQDANRPLGRAPWGVSTKAIEIALDHASNRGIDIDMVVAIARDELGSAVAQSSVRTMLGKLTKSKELRRQRGRWYRAKKTESPPAPEDTVARPGEGDRAAGDR